VHEQSAGSVEGSGDGAIHVGPDALVRAGEQRSPGLAVASKTAELRSAARVGAPAPRWFVMAPDAANSRRKD
jgi:hypothetical protein